MGDEVKLFGTWGSPISRRVDLALKLKGIQYEYIEEVLSNKSPLLLKYNPSYNKVPVLVHNGKPIASGHPTLAWATIVRVLQTAHKVRLSQSKKEQMQAIEEVQEQLKLLENELKGKDFFGGNTIGYVDIVAHVIAFWFGVTQEVTDVEWFTEERYPILFKWRGKYQEIDSDKECRPENEKYLGHIRARLDASKSASK